jgi:hypothetical protein
MQLETCCTGKGLENTNQLDRWPHKKRKLGAALGMSCSGISGGKCLRYEPLVIYISPVIPEALVVLYDSGCCCFLCVMPFAAKGRSLEGPQAQGRIL